MKAHPEMGLRLWSTPILCGSRPALNCNHDDALGFRVSSSAVQPVQPVHGPTMGSNIPYM